MDQIVEFINANTDRYRELYDRDVSIRYSTMHDYFSAIQQPIKEQGITFPIVKGSPFMPYWSGYYAGYPNLKREYSEVMVLLRHAEAAVSSLAFAAHAGLPTAFTFGSGAHVDRFITQAMEQLDAANAHIALVSHHDAIPGTGYSFFTRDTYRRMTQARTILIELIEATVGRTIGDGGREGAGGSGGGSGRGPTARLEIALAAVPSARVPFGMYGGTTKG